MKHTKIETTEAVRRFNAVLELADIATWHLLDRKEPRDVQGYLESIGHMELADDLIEVGSPLGYFAPETPDNPGERSESGREQWTKSQYKMSADCPEPAWLNADIHLEKERWKIALQRIAYRGNTGNYKDAFGMCQLIAKEALRAI